MKRCNCSSTLPQADHVHDPDCPLAMTKTEAVRKINELPHMKARVEKFDTNEIRVAYRGLSKEREEAGAYYTTDPQDAYDTAVLTEGKWEQWRK